jgi:hypothetical protein
MMNSSLSSTVPGVGGVMVACLLAFATRLDAQGPRWYVEATPAVRLGVSESPDGLFAAPSGATRLPNGNIVVGDQGDYALREFTPKGALVKRFGRKGRGPGEITYLAPLLRCGDSLVTHDIGESSRLSIFQLDGTFVRAFRLAQTPYRLSCTARLQFGIMGWGGSSGERSPHVFRPVVPYWISRADSSNSTAVGTLPGGDRTTNDQRPLPLGRDPRVAISASRMYIAPSDSFLVLVYDHTGKALSPLIARVPRVRATLADFTAEREREIAMVGERARKMVEATYSSITMPTFLPATRDLIVDADDNLWVQHFPRALSVTVAWTVFSPGGKTRATVVLPTALEVYEIGRDYVLGRYVDPGLDPKKWTRM